MYSQIIKKSKKEMEDLAPQAKPLHIGKKAMKHAMSSMAPEMEDEEEDEEYEQEEGSLSKKDMSKFEGSKSTKKGVLPEAKIEIELMLNSAKKKKK